MSVKTTPWETRARFKLKYSPAERTQDKGGTYDERLEDVQADVLGVRAGQVRTEERRERGRVDGGGLDQSLHDLPVGTSRRGAVGLHTPVHPDDARSDEH